MGADQTLSELARLAGIFAQFKNLDGVMCPITPDTQRALLRANGLLADTPAQAAETLAMLKAEAAGAFVSGGVVVLPCGQPVQVQSRQSVSWELVPEGTSGVVAHGHDSTTLELPALPAGLHDLHLRKAAQRQRVTVIATPPQAPSVQDRAGVDKTWGVVAALYGLTSERTRGIGDFEDLARLAEALGGCGADFLGINPVHALGWSADDVISPYSPSHRGFLNTAHIALGDGADVGGARGDLIDYGAHRHAHHAALRAAFARFDGTASTFEKQALADFTRTGGADLRAFAHFEALSEKYGPDWQAWPAALQTPQTAQDTANPQDARFHIWLQWQAATQLGAAQTRAKNSGMALGLYLDLAVGARLGGAEAWAAADTLAQGIALGAPPDQLSPAGQNWQLAAYAPRKLKQARYGPLRQVLAQAMRHCGVFRIDHALGLNRSYWIPEDGSPGGYIRQPFQALRAIIAIEAHKAGTVIIGEDLGLVPDGFRDSMERQGIYGYTVMQYEQTPKGRFRTPKDLRPQSLACFGTHDTPTLRGFWQGHDIGWWHKLGWIDDAEQAKLGVRRQTEKADLMDVPVEELDTCDAADLRDRVHAGLASGPTALVAVQLDDLLDVPEAQNLPGTIDVHPNWRRRSPATIKTIADHPDLLHTAALMAKAGRGRLREDS